MKKVALVLAVAGLAATATVSFAGRDAATGVNGSWHDINTFAGTYQQDDWLRVCVFCHTPHNAGDTQGDPALPLWNHEASQAASWTPYTWATPANDDLAGQMAAGQVMAITDPLQGPSRMCMSCHDGVTSVDQHGTGSANMHPAAGTTAMGGFRAIGLLRGQAGTAGDVSDDHPIGFNYVNAKNWRNSGDPLRPEIVDENEKFATAVSTTTFTGEAAVTNYNTVTRDGVRQIKEVLYQGNIMTCASCHEVHNYRNVASTAADVAPGVTELPNMFLYAKERDSLICLSCHYK